MRKAVALAALGGIFLSIQLLLRPRREGAGAEQTAQTTTPVSTLLAAEPERLLVAGDDAGYVDSAVCAECHPGIAATYRHTGMGGSFARLRPDTVLEDFTRNNTFYHQAADRYYRMYQREGKYFARRHQIGFDGREINVVEKEIHFVLGSGNHSRSYLHRTPEGRLLQLPIAWYPENGGFWGMSPGYDRANHMDFRREIDYECFSCHNAYPEIVAGSDSPGSAPLFPGRIPEGIDCQRCHGPARDHVVAMKSTEPPRNKRATIVNPARLTFERQLEVCMQCHLETTSRGLPHALLRYGRGFFSYRPGEPLEDYMLHFDHPAGAGYDDKFEIASAAYRLRKSLCFQAAAGAMTCTTCHNPHEAPRGREAIEKYSAVCRSCHAGEVAALIQDERHPEARECITCHMPKRRTEDAVHVVMTDHYIQRRSEPGRDLLAPLQEVHDDEGSGYRGEVVPYYPARLPQAPENDIYLAIAQVKDQANLEQGIPLLEKALGKHMPRRPEFFLDAAEAYRDSGEIDKAVGFYERALAERPDFLPALRNGGLALLTAGRLERAETFLESALATVPSEPTLLSALGVVYLQRGKLREAVTTLRKALDLRPELAEAQSNLGAALLRTGRQDEAEAALREAIRIRPRLAAAHQNLAQLVQAKGNFQEAKYFFEKAVDSEPRNAVLRQNFAMALLQDGSLDEAQEQFEAALGLEDVNRAAIYNNIGTVRARKNDPDGAIRYYRLALSTDPGFAMAHFSLGVTLAKLDRRQEAQLHLRDAVRRDPDLLEAHFKLGELLAAQGDRAEAARHFKEAVRSPDANLRQAALAALAALDEN